jgi:hypothetical protein
VPGEQWNLSAHLNPAQNPARDTEAPAGSCLSFSSPALSWLPVLCLPPAPPHPAQCEAGIAAGALTPRTTSSSALASRIYLLKKTRPTFWLLTAGLEPTLRPSQLFTEIHKYTLQHTNSHTPRQTHTKTHVHVHTQTTLTPARRCYIHHTLKHFQTHTNSLLHTVSNLTHANFTHSNIHPPPKPVQNPFTHLPTHANTRTACLGGRSHSLSI